MTNVVSNLLACQGLQGLAQEGCIITAITLHGGVAFYK